MVARMVSNFRSSVARAHFHPGPAQPKHSSPSPFLVTPTGTYHKLYAKHLDAYLDELEWGFNNRMSPWLFRDTLIKLLDPGK
jgi:hypothetical protein